MGNSHGPAGREGLDEDDEPDTEFEAAASQFIPEWQARQAEAERLYGPGTVVDGPDGDRGVVLAIDSHGDVHVQMQRTGIGIYSIEKLKRFTAKDERGD